MQEASILGILLIKNCLKLKETGLNKKKDHDIARTTKLGEEIKDVSIGRGVILGKRKPIRLKREAYM